jgi:hypothetical protein
MAIVNEFNEVLHRIRVKLYPNYLPQVEGKYIARTNNEALLSIEQVCAALKNRGGFTGNVEDLIVYVSQFLDEAAYQLCDGYAVNLKYFSVHPNVGGTFNSFRESHDSQRHPVTFRFRSLQALLRLARHITIEVEGLADCNAYIDEFTDTDEKSTNEWFLPGDQFVLEGSLIKLAGENPGVGVFFVPVGDPAKAVKATRIADNSGSKIIGICPDISISPVKIEVRTQYTGSSTQFLKSPRVIASPFTLEHA